MSRVRHDLVTRLWRGRDPFLDLPSDLPSDLREVDMRGASQGHAFIGPAVAAAHPGIVVDVGAGKGGSTIAFARELRNGRMNAVVVAVDTFLGDVSSWSNDEEFEGMEYEAGRSSLYPRFVGNILQAGLGSFVLPLTLDATTAAALFARFGIPASIVHLDAGHDPGSIRAYLEAWWPLLAPGGVLIGGPCADGQDASNQAYEAFFAAQGVQATFQDGKCQAIKPAAEGSNESPKAARVFRLGGHPLARAPGDPPLQAAATEPAAAETSDEPPKTARVFRLGGRPVARREET
ncbi:MAG TPA: class I SAM-dependent methyltransferase [Acetobacteraceae bacterium]|nr:class I SAM-dependent methyltransferase [Acetobacteraceae bacterium]